MNVRACFLPRVFACMLLLAMFCTASLAQQYTVHPALSFSSYLLHPEDRINAVKVGSDGSVYVAGVSVSTPAILDPMRLSAGEGRAFVAKFSPDGAKLVYFSYLSNSPADEARAIAIDNRGNVYVAGVTRSQDFPVVKPLQASCKPDGAGQCAGTAFVAKVNPAGAVIFASYLGGSNHDEANAIVVDRLGNMVVAGYTQSLDFPVENAVQQTASGNGDAFVAAIAADGSHLLFSTYLGGSDADEARALALDASGNIYLTGKTTSLDFPTEAALQEKCLTDAHGECSGTSFVTELSGDGKTVLYSTYLGGSGEDAGNAIAVDARGNAYIAGVTSSKDFPTSNAGQRVLKGRRNAFVSEISSRGSALLFSTYLGGSVADQADAIALDSSGSIAVSGWTHSPDFPVQDALQASCNRGKNNACSLDAFAAVLTPDGSHLLFSTYLGGTGADVSRALAVDAEGSAYLGGWTTSRDFAQAKSPVSSADVETGGTAILSRPGGAFVAKISGLGNTKAKPGACTNNWTGAAGDNQWNDAGNWSSDSVPVATDSVCIATTFSNAITVGGLSTENQTIRSLSAGAPIAFTSGPLAISSTSTFTASLTVSGGTLTLNGTTNLATVSESGGTLTGSGSASASGPLALSGGTLSLDHLIVSSQMNWTGGAISGTGSLTIAKAAALSITAPYFSSISLATTLINQGTVTENELQSYGFAVLSPGNITNSGSWTLTGDVAVTASGAVNFTNLGSFVKSGGTATTNWQVPISGSGTINIESGTLNLYGASTGTITGKITVGSGATLQYGQGGTLENAEVTGKGTFNFTASATVTGTYSFTATAQIQGGTVSFDGLTTAATLNIQGGTASFNAAITVANFNLTSGSADFNVTATTAIGNLTFSGGNLTMNSIASLNAGTLTLSASSTLNLQLGSGTASIQVSGSVDLAGNLNFSTTVGYDPAIGTLIPVLVFANGFSGNFGSIGGLSLGDGDGLSVDLSTSGFSLTVTNPPTGSFQRAGSQPASSFKSRPPAR